MPKGDGWAVKRYVCPKCKRKGLYFVSVDNYSKFHCMYHSCLSWEGTDITKDEIVKANPELLKEKARWKP